MPEPFDGKPSEALAAGVCPYCMGTGEVENLIYGKILCRLCNGSRKWPPEGGQGSFTCPRCGATSYHPHDIEEGYCGACHDWTRV